MELAFWISVGVIFILLCLSAFFSGSETALTAASRAKMHSLAKEGNKRAGLINRLREEKDKLIGALLLGNNLVNILASALATSVLIKLFGDSGVVYATLVMTFLVLIFAEVLPKSYAITHSDKMALAIAPIIRPVVWLFSPITQAIVLFVRFLLKLFGVDLTQNHDGGKEELLGVIELHQGDEEEIKEERAMLRSILDLAEVDVDEIMTHRRNVVMIDVGLSTGEIVEAVLNCPYTRIPLFRDSKENIVGVLHVRTLLKALNANQGKADNINVTRILSDPWFIPDTTTLFDQLQEFRARREHFALVVDEYGSFEGIVTLEDILEEIVGEIDDESDIAVAGVHAQAGGASYLVDGTVTIRDLNREFEWNLPDQEDYSTVAGLVIHEAKLLPETGQSFSFYGCRFDVLERQENQIAKMRVTPKKEKQKTGN